MTVDLDLNNDVFDRARPLALDVIDALQGETPACAIFATALALVGMFRAAGADEQLAHALIDGLFLVTP